MPLKSVLQHVTMDGSVNFNIDKAIQMKGWLACLRGEHEWFPIICVRQQDDVTLVILDDGKLDDKNLHRKYAANDVLCVPANTVGHWTINGKSMCQTSYECKRSLQCACTHQEYLSMSKAVKNAHPDGSAEWVSHTRWHPTSCPESNDRDKPDYNITCSPRIYVNLALLAEALELTTGGVTNSSGYEVSLHHDDWPNINYVTMNHALMLRVSRYTMNPLGTHIGYEEYEGVLEILPARGSESCGMHDWSDWVADIDSLDARIISAPETEICACESGDCGCPEDKYHICKDECQCELYMGADDDYAWDCVEDVLTKALDVPLYWHFNKDEPNPMTRWRIVNRRTDEIVWEPDISSMPAAQAPLV